MELLKHNKPFYLESGFVLPELEIAYHTYGELNSDKSNVLWVCHALTANSNVPDWWNGVFGIGRALDPSTYFIVCANTIGSCYGSSGPLSKHLLERGLGHHLFPEFTIRDVVAAHELLCQHLHIDSIALLVGASLGGQQALEWSISNPFKVKKAVFIACNAFHSPFGIACNESQRMAIEADQSWKSYRSDSGLKGLKAARSMALLSYRTYAAYEKSQSETNREKRGNYKASAYQNHQGNKLVKRFNAFSYYRLTQAMDSHQVGRKRGGVASALSEIRAKTLILSIEGDVLFPQIEQMLLHKYIEKSSFKKVYTSYGHDGFLIETEQISQSIQSFLSACESKEQNTHHE